MPRVPDQYVWLVWSGAFVITWGGLFAAFRRLRSAMWWVSLLTAPFGVTQMFFVGVYWDPPTVLTFPSMLHGVGKVPLDIESFLFCFGIGGVAEVLFNIISRRPLLIPPKTAAQARHQQVYVGMFLFPFLLYLPMASLTGRPLWSGVVLTWAGAAARMAMFPSLREKTAAGGVLFLAYYSLFLALLCLISPGYIGRVWRHTIPGGHILGVPWAELFFALGVGMFWSGIYEHVIWTFSPPRSLSKRANAEGQS